MASYNSKRRRRGRRSDDEVDVEVDAIQASGNLRSGAEPHPTSAEFIHREAMIL